MNNCLGQSILIHKYCGGVSLIEQKKIEYVIHYQFFEKKIFSTFISCNVLVLTLQYLKKNEKNAHENMKKLPQKLLIIGPNLNICSIKIAHRVTYV